MGGAEKQSLMQAKLMRDEFVVYYFVQKKKHQIKRHLEFIEKEKINYIQLTGNIISRTVQLIKFIRKYQIKVLFTFLPLDNLLGSIVSVFLRIKFVGGVRNSHLPFIKFHVNWILQKYFLDYVIFNNHYGRELFIKRGFSPAKSIVIQNCIDNIHKDIVRQEGDTIKILSVGRFTAQKDYFTALKAISLLQKRDLPKKIEYIIVGEGELDSQIQAWAKEMEINDVTIIRNPDRIDDYYIDSDIYFLSSIFEGMPNSIMEALNYSLPVVTTDVGDAKYLVKDGQNGFIVPIGDSAMLADKLFVLVSDSKKRDEFGILGHKLLEKDFSEDKYRDEYVTFTKKII
jgi:glycosyltransferase involved in cell wall biosynthesis